MRDRLIADLDRGRDYLRSRSAWIIGAVTAGGGLFVAWPAIDSAAIAVTLGAIVFLSVAGLAVARRDLFARDAEIEAVRRSRGDLVRIVDDGPACIWKSSTGVERTFVSESWRTFTGLSAIEAVNGEWLGSVHEDDRSAVEAAIRLASAHGEAWEVAYRILDANGSYVAVADRATPVRDAEGALAGFLGMTVTGALPSAAGAAPTDAETSLRTLNQRINTMAIDLADRFARLEEAKQRTAYAERIKSEFLAALAGDLRPPIEQVRHMTEMLRTPELPALFRPFVDQLDKAVRALHDLGERTERFGERAIDDGPPEIEEFDLRRLIEQVVDDQQAAAERRGISAAATVTDRVPVAARTDPTLLRTMLLDLWKVALTATKRGRIVLRVICEHEKGEESMLRFALAVPGSSVTDGEIERAYYPAHALGGGPAGLGLGHFRRVAERLGAKHGIHRSQADTVEFWFLLRVETVHRNWDGRRAHGRFLQDSVRSNLGAVLDLSMGGMRIRTTSARAGLLDVELCDEEETLNLQAAVAWTRRIGFGRHEMGLKFEAMSGEQTLRLSRLAARNRLRRAVEAA